MRKDKKIKLVVFAMLIFILGLFIIKACPVVLQNDTLYDIKLGERYITKGMFHIDDYSIHTNLVYQTHHYLVCLLDYIIYHLFSFPGIYILEILLTSLITLLMYKIGKETIKNKFLNYVILFFFLIALSPFISLRAQMYSYIVFLLEILFIEKYLNHNNKRDLAVLALLPLILINFHSGVIYFYFIIMGTYLLNAIKCHFIIFKSDERVNLKQVKELLISSFIGALLTLINPYGIDGITYGLKTLNSYYISNYITEFQPFKISTPTGILIVLYMILCYSSLVFSRKKISIHQLLLIGGTTLMAFMSTRHFSLLVITSVVILPHIESAYERIDNSQWDLVKSFKNGVNSMNILVVVLYAIMTVYLVSCLFIRENTPLPKYQYPIDALKYIKKNIPNARIFNHYEWGSYMIFEGVKTFVDPRCDLFNQEYNKDTRVMEDYIKTTNNMRDYGYVVSKYDIDYFFLDRKMNLAKRMISDHKYQIVYKDDIAVIFKVIK